MKFFKIIFLTFLTVVFLLLLGLAVYLRLYGVELTQAVLSEIFLQPFQVRSVRLSFPLVIRLDGVNVKDVLEIPRVNIHISLPRVDEKKFVLSSVDLIEPVFWVRKTEAGRFAWGHSPAKETAEEPRLADGAAVPWPERTIGSSRVRIEFLQIEKGRFFYLDDTAGAPLSFSLSEIDMRLRPVAYPPSAENSRFRLSGLLQGEKISFSGSSLEAQGWFNWGIKDMDVALKIVRPSQRVVLSAQLLSKTDDLTVTGTMNISSLKSRAVIEESLGVSPGDFIISAMQASGLDVGVDFSFKTRMSAFDVKNVSLRGTVTQGDKPEPVADGLRIISQQFEALGRKFLGEEVKGPVENPSPVAVPREAEIAPAENTAPVIKGGSEGEEPLAE